MKALEKKLSNNTSDDNIHEEKHASAYKPTHKKTHKSPLYRVIKIRPAAIIAVIAVMAIVAVTVSVVTRRTIRNEVSDENSGTSTALSTKPDEQSEPPISYEFSADTAEIPASNDAGRGNNCKFKHPQGHSRAQCRGAPLSRFNH